MVVRSLSIILRISLIPAAFYLRRSGASPYTWFVLYPPREQLF